MLADHLARGAKAGAAGGLAFGAFVATVADPLVGYAEAHAHGDGHEAGHHAAAAGEGFLATVTADAISVGGGVLWGVLLGVVAFGAAYYLLEPALPGTGATRSYALGAAGFVTVSGAPWLVLPPSPPGVQSTISTTTGLALYGVLVVAGGLACAGALLAYRRARRARGRLTAALAGSLPPLALVAVAVAAPSTTAGGALPEALAAGLTAVVAFGQALLWTVLAATHAHLQARADDANESIGSTDAHAPTAAD